MILYFPDGLPGFERDRHFTVSAPADLAPVVCLQSLKSPQLRLWAAPVPAVDARYSLDISREDLRTLGLDTARRPVMDEDVVCLAILCLAEGSRLTANLLAPIVVNVRTHVALQAVRSDTRYSHRHLISPAPVSEKRHSGSSPWPSAPGSVKPQDAAEDTC